MSKTTQGVHTKRPPKLITPPHQADQHASFWGTLAIISVVLLAFLALGGYFFNWTWTGFQGNTLWDWLQLLVLPLTLTTATTWFSKGTTWRKEWSAFLVLLLIALVVLAVGGYGMNWTWTGFQGNTFWDWLKLLLLPIALMLLTLRLSQSPSPSTSASKR